MELRHTGALKAEDHQTLGKRPVYSLEAGVIPTLRIQSIVRCTATKSGSGVGEVVHSCPPQEIDQKDAMCSSEYSEPSSVN